MLNPNCNLNKITWLGLGKDHVLATRYLVLPPQNVAVNCLEVSLKTSSGVTLRNVRTPSSLIKKNSSPFTHKCWNAVSNCSLLHLQLHHHRLHLSIWKSGHKHVIWAWHDTCTNSSMSVFFHPFKCENNRNVRDWWIFKAMKIWSASLLQWTMSVIPVTLFIALIGCRQQNQLCRDLVWGKKNHVFFKVRSYNITTYECFFWTDRRSVL